MKMIQQSSSVIQSILLIRSFFSNHATNTDSDRDVARDNNSIKTSLISTFNQETMSADKSTDGGLMRPRPLLFLILWYFFSFTTILLNKHILTTLKGDAVLLATAQVSVE